MKKIFAIIILGIFVVVLAMPFVANAQAIKLQECCELKADVRITKGRTAEGDNTNALVFKIKMVVM